MPQRQGLDGLQSALKGSIGFIATATVLLLMLVPWQPRLPSIGLDPSWHLVIEWAFLSGKDFGHDLIFTHGPLGFLITRLYHPELFAYTIAFWTLVALALAAFLSRYWRGAPLWVGLTTLPFLLLVLGPELVDAAVILLPLATALTVIDRRGRSDPFLAMLLLTLTITAGLAKLTVLITAGVIFVALDLHRALIERRFPVFVPVWLLTSWAAYALLTGSTDFIAFVLGGIEISRGYSAAMTVEGPHYQVAVLVLLAVTLPLLMARAISPSAQWRRPTLALIFTVSAVTVFMLFKTAIVRHDTGHIYHAVTGFMIIAIVATLSASARPGRRWLLAGGMTWIAAIAIFMVSIPWGLDRQWNRRVDNTHDPIQVAKTTLVEAPQQRFESLRSLVFGGGYARLPERREAALAGIRAQSPLPVIEGSVDIYPWQTAIPLAHGLDYRPRPIIQNYTTYTPRLVDLNYRFLESDQAPDTLLFQVDTIDDRYETVDDGKSWRPIIARYEPAETAGKFLLLKRRRVDSMEFDEHPLGERRIAWGETLKLDSTAPCLWAEVEIDPNPVGRLLRLLYKEPAVHLVVQTGPERTKEAWRFVPIMARSGFLLSPCVVEAAQLRGLCRGPAAPEDRVRGIRFETWGFGPYVLEPQIRVRLTELTLVERPQGASEDPGPSDGDPPLPAH